MIHRSNARISSVITCSSSGGALTVLQYLISNEAPLSFDELHDRMPTWTREVQDAMRQARGSSTYAMFLYGGWSDREGGWLIYQICDYELDRGDAAAPPFRHADLRLLRQAERLT